MSLLRCNQCVLGGKSDYKLKIISGFKIKKTNDVIWLVPTIALQIFLLAQTFLKVLPPTNGFFLYWARLSNESTVYKDFYFPLPPVGLLVEGQFPLLFGSPVIAEQWIQAFKWLLICLVLFCILLQLGFNGLSSFLGVTVSASAYLVSPGNITAGYLELVWLFILLGVYFSLQTFSSKHSPFSPLLSGVFFSLAALTKQSALIIAFFAVLGFVAIILYLKETSSRQKIQLFIIGILIPFLFVFFWLFIYGNATEFIQQAFGFGGKNPGKSNWKFWLLDGFGIKSQILPLILIFFSIFTAYSITSEKSKNLQGMNKFKVSISFLLLALSILMINGINLLTGAPSGKSSSILILFVVLLAIGGILSENKIINDISTLMMSLVVIVFGIVAVLFGATLLTHDVPKQNWYFTFLPNMNLLGAMGTVALLCLGFLFFKTKTNQSNHQFLFVGIIAASFALMNSLSGGLSIETWLLGLSFAIAWIASNFFLHLPTNIAKASVVLLFSTVLFAFSASQQENPYDWWGIKVDSLIAQPHFSNSEVVPGFTLGENTAKFYESVDSAFTEIGKSLDDDRVLFGPNLAGLAGSLYPNIQTYKLNCPILWWDICTASNSASDLKKIISDPPEVIVWYAAPEEVISGHELGFGGGEPSSIRAIQNWILEQISEGNYKVVASRALLNGPEDKWRLYVLEKIIKN